MSDGVNYAGIAGGALGPGVVRGIQVGLQAAPTLGYLIAGSTGAETLGIGAAVGAIVLAISSFFHGADPRQVPASKIEQVFELASDTIINLIQAGLITPDEGISALNSFLQAAVQLETNANLGQATTRAIANVTKVLNNQIAVAKGFPDKVTSSSDLSTAKQYYAKQGIAGLNWYPDSIAAADKVMDAYLATLPPRSSLLSIPGAASITGAVETIGKDLSVVIASPWLKVGLIALAIFIGVKLIL